MNILNIHRRRRNPSAVYGPGTAARRFELPLLWILLLFIPLLSRPTIATSQAQRPELIRDTDQAEGKPDPDLEKPREFNPLQAEKSYEIGKFYFKKKNYAAAVDRYREALEFHPQMAEARKALAEAYIKLARQYEKDGNLEEAIDTYRQYIRDYPDSSDNAEIQKIMVRLAEDI
jgi:tetratricopeptide (TPR) repeat protein